MELNTTYVHAHQPERFTCIPLDYTSNGCKVAQTETVGPRKKPKTTTQYYNATDFKSGGLWVRKA